MTKTTQTPMLSRRTVLRGIGTTLALPWLEAMGPLTKTAKAAADQSRSPTRMAFVYVPNGVHMPDWNPKAVGKDYEITKILEPLSEFRDDMIVFSGLAADKARANGDGGGDHARAMAAYLTGAQPLKTDGSKVRAGISVDQIAASRVGQQTRLPSLELGTEPTNMAGSCDTGYSCVYNSTLSWRSATTPLPKIFQPRDVYDRLFGTNKFSSKGILDVVLEDSRDLHGKLGASDRRKLDEYFSSIRDVEQRMERASKIPAIETPNFTFPAGIPEVFADYLKILSDLVVLAFQTDTTRVVTYCFANESSNRIYPEIGIRDGHHETSHHQNRADRQAMIREINIYHIKQFAYFVGRLKSIQEGDSTLLDNSMIVYGSGNADGNSHTHHNLPTLLLGKGGGTISSGRHIKLEKETPINNLWLSMLDRMDSGVETFGDATGRLTQLDV